MRIFSLFLLSLLLLIGLSAQQTHLSLRPSLSLNGQWNFIVDPYENGFYNYRYEPFDSSRGIPRSAYFSNTKPTDKSDLIEYDFDRSDVMTVPGDWNTQKEKLFYYEGTVWYKRSFDHRKNNASNRLFVTFGAVNYQADVYLNGKKLGIHVGGFTPFNYEITDLVRERDNFLIVKVDNKRKKEGVPTLNTDWWNYGGISRRWPAPACARSRPI
jgi:beta-glucuronidase